MAKIYKEVADTYKFIRSCEKLSADYTAMRKSHAAIKRARTIKYKKAEALKVAAQKLAKINRAKKIKIAKSALGYGTVAAMGISSAVRIHKAKKETYKTIDDGVKGGLKRHKTMMTSLKKRRKTKNNKKK